MFITQTLSDWLTLSTLKTQGPFTGAICQCTFCNAISYSFLMWLSNQGTYSQRLIFFGTYEWAQ